MIDNTNTLTTTSTVSVPGIGPVSLTVTERGSGHPFLLLHGGGGPQTVARFAEILSTAEQAHLFTPIHPGFDGTPRPDNLTSMAGIAAVYAAYLEQRGLQDVTIIGNSIGGWIAAELALLRSPWVSSLVLVDAVGLEVPGHPVTDVRPLTLDELTRLSFHDPSKFRIDPSRLSEEQRAGMAANRATLYLYGGESMTDSTLGERLARIEIPTLVVWGTADQIVDLAYGQAYADAIPAARLTIVPEAGHLPQIETPEILARMVWQFADAHVATQR
jgi:pimeloyl-ACP methyl ester carboxylesterase